MTAPHPIPYQGSKRRLAPAILAHLPPRIDTLYEPFAGSAAVSIAAAQTRPDLRVCIGDSLAPLIDLWDGILAPNQALADGYEALWHAQQRDDPRAFYDRVRDAFNAEGGAARLLFLLARCVKNAVRFNQHGAFNQSPDTRRLGAHPDRVRRRIQRTHTLLAHRTRTFAGDYADLIQRATPSDVVYLDPPYQGTSGPRDRRYHQPLDLQRFIQKLTDLRQRGVPFLVSFDGRCGERTYGPHLPEHLGLTRLELHAGRSSQATLNGRAHHTYESLYLSPELATLKS